MKKILIILALAVTLVFSAVIYITVFSEEEFVTEVFDICSYSKVGQEVTYSVYVEEDGEYINIDSAEFNFPDCLEKYYWNVKVRVVYSKKDYKAEQCVLLNPETGMEITDFAEENFEKIVNIEYGKNIVEKKMSEKINLSELTPEEIYKYTKSKKITEMEVINDTGKDCIIYVKTIRENDLIPEVYECAINPCGGDRMSISLNVHEEIQAFNIMYKIVSTEEILQKIKEEDIIRLSEHQIGETLEYTFFENYDWAYYIYNDTNKKITLVIKDFVIEDLEDIENIKEKIMTIEIESDRIYGFPHVMTRSITILD